MWPTLALAGAVAYMLAKKNEMLHSVFDVAKLQHEREHGILSAPLPPVNGYPTRAELRHAQESATPNKETLITHTTSDETLAAMGSEHFNTITATLPDDTPILAPPRAMTNHPVKF